jgi:hypothetical protein
MTVFWSMLFERYVSGELVGMMQDISAAAALSGAMHINIIPQRTDMARNTAVKVFRKYSTDAADVLVMLDNDHRMPFDVVPKLASQVDAEHQVVGALAFRRSPPYDPCYFKRSADGQGLDLAVNFASKLEGPFLCVGTGAIAIRRSVFDALDAAGMPWPYFRYSYHEGDEPQRSEDFEFSLLCEKVGIGHWVDTSFYIPHQTSRYVGYEDFVAVLKEAENDPDKANAKYAGIGLRFGGGSNGNGVGAQHVEELPSVG